VHPILFEYGSLAIYTYGVFVALGFIAAFWVGEREADRFGLGRRAFQDLGFLIVIGAIAGSRLFFVLLEWEHFVEKPLEIFALWKGGLVFYGGFVGAGLAGLWYARSRSLPLWTAADCVAPALALGQAFGRVGCFFAGCCYGAASHLPWAVSFDNPRSIVPLERLGIGLHPTQLYEAAANLALFLLLYFYLGRHRRFEGQLFGVYLVAYPALRFLIEFFRGDPRGGLGPLSTSQVLGIPLFFFGLWILLSRRQRPREVPSGP
jgi:phosphatidylglycerol---prolipoprotein diacylglyceryl transferase